jgi:predicted  nucleic acid-binding Zn-ribbon protein
VASQNIKGIIRQLVSMQQIDEELFGFRREIRQKPEELARLKEDFDSKKAFLNKLEARARELELARKGRELELKSKEQDISRSSTSLMALKSNREYQARMFEIESMKAEQSAFESEVLKLMDDSEKVGKQIEAEKAVVTAEEKKYLAEKEKVDAVVDKLTQDSSGLEARRREVMVAVDKEALAIYERIVENRDGVAIVPVVNKACGGCFMHLPDQVINNIKKYDKLVRCEICARFQYIQEDL